MADGCVEPCWQKSAVWFGRMRAAIHTRACLSIAKLCALDWLVQIASSPQYGDGCRRRRLRFARRLRIANLQLHLRSPCCVLGSTTGM